jgi:class 3 adenylate cyclase
LYIKPHFKTVIFASYIKMIERNYPEINIKELICKSGLDWDYIQNENNWVSVLFEKNFMNELVNATGDLGLYRRAGKFGITKIGLGAPIYFLARYVLPLEAIYRSLPKLTPLLNKVIEIKLISFNKNLIKYEFKLILEGLTPAEKEILKDRFPAIIENTVGYYSAIPTIKGLPEAKVSCINKNEKNHIKYDIIVEVANSSLIFDKGINYFPFIAYAVTIIFYFLNNNLSIFAFSVITNIFLLIFSIKSIIKVMNLKIVTSQAEESIYKMDSQYKEIHETHSKLERKLSEVEAINILVTNIIDAQSVDEILENGCKVLRDKLKFDRAFILLKEENENWLSYQASSGLDENFVTILKKFKLPTALNDDDPGKLTNVFRFNKTLLVKNALDHLKKLDDPSSKLALELSGTTSFVATPISTPNGQYGLLVADCVTKNMVMTEDDARLVSLFGTQIAIAFEKQKAKQELVDSYENEIILSQSYSRFVPFETLKMLNYKNVIDVKLGECIEKKMAILFSDIRDFTSLCENMTPSETLKFLNSYYASISPIIKANGGTIDKYMGDGIMAIFESVESGINAAIEINRHVVSYNVQHRLPSKQPIEIGVGICEGPVVFGSLGSEKRLELTALSDTVNIASRLDGLCKTYKANILVSIDRSCNLEKVKFKINSENLGKINVKGKSKPVSVLKISDSELDKFCANFPNSYENKEYLKNILSKAS